MTINERRTIRIVNAKFPAVQPDVAVLITAEVYQYSLLFYATETGVAWPTFTELIPIVIPETETPFAKLYNQYYADSTFSFDFNLEVIFNNEGYLLLQFPTYYNPNLGPRVSCTIDDQDV